MGLILKREKCLMFIFVLLGISNFAFSQSDTMYYKVNKIDSVTLHYYYVLKITPLKGDSIVLNLLSKKEGCLIEGLKRIKEGDSLCFNLEPLYSIMDKRNEKDSVYFSPAMMRIVEFNGEVFINYDYSIYPYTSENIKCLFYFETSDN